MLIYSKYNYLKRYFLVSSSKNFSKAGFTLIELLVVISIFTIITTALVIQQNKWYDRLSVSTQAYEMVLAIRQAQVYSLGVKESNDITGDKFNAGYGIYIDKNNLNQYVYFVDKNQNQKYDSGEEIGTTVFTKGVTIQSVCGSSGGQACFPGPGPLAQVGILFYRPEAKATISLLNNGGNSVNSPPVIITLRSVNGSLSVITADSSGQISIQ